MVVLELKGTRQVMPASSSGGFCYVSWISKNLPNTPSNENVWFPRRPLWPCQYHTATCVFFVSFFDELRTRAAAPTKSVAPQLPRGSATGRCWLPVDNHLRTVATRLEEMRVLARWTSNVIGNRLFLIPVLSLL